jgi:uncharacterized protein YxeA
MRKIVITLSIIVLVSVATYYFFFREVRGTDEVFLIPEGLTGCVGVYYNDSNAKPLTKKDNKILYSIPADGKLMTSSPQYFGWANKNESGSFNADFYYVDKKGEKIEKISSEKVGLEYTNETYSSSTGKTMQSYTFYLSDKKNKFPDGVECDLK